MEVNRRLNLTEPLTLPRRRCISNARLLPLARTGNLGAGTSTMPPSWIVQLLHLQIVNLNFVICV